MSEKSDAYLKLRADLCTFSKEALALYIAQNANSKTIIAEIQKKDLDLQLEDVNQQMQDLLFEMDECRNLPDFDERSTTFSKLNEKLDAAYKHHDALLRKRYTG